MMTIKELSEILEETKNNHGWNDLYTNHESGRKSTKYVDVCFDTRDGHIWRICFRDIVGGNRGDHNKDGVVFAHEKCTKEKILEWLNEDCSNKKGDK